MAVIEKVGCMQNKRGLQENKPAKQIGVMQPLEGGVLCILDLLICVSVHSRPLGAPGTFAKGPDMHPKTYLQHHCRCMHKLTWLI